MFRLLLSVALRGAEKSSEHLAVSSKFLFVFWRMLKSDTTLKVFSDSRDMKCSITITTFDDTH